MALRARHLKIYYFWAKSLLMSVPEQIMESIKRYCAYQERCHSEVRYKLIALGCYGEELEEAIGMLIEEDFLNEERFATAYAGGKFRMRSWGRLKIKQHLKQKQVSDYCIRRAMKAIAEEEYVQRMEQLMEKKLEAMQHEPNPWKRQQKIFAYMMQKGYEYDLIKDSWQAIQSKLAK